MANFEGSFASENSQSQPASTKMKNGGQIQIQPFIVKLIALINDPTNGDLIYWSQDGDTFKVANMKALAENELPKYFKHNTFASLVRQLNMYGFHKVPANPIVKMTTKAEQEIVEFHHPCVHRDHPELLTKIKRKEPKKHPAPAPPLGDHKMCKSEIHQLHNEMKMLKEENLKLRQHFQTVQSQNESLWKEVAEHRKRHAQQQWTIDNIMKYLSVLYSKGEIDLPTQSFLTQKMTDDHKPKRQRITQEKAVKQPKKRTVSAPPVVTNVTPTSLGLHPQPDLLSGREGMHHDLKQHVESVHNRLHSHRVSLSEHMPEHWIESIFNPPESYPKTEKDSSSKDNGDDFMENFELGNFNLAPLDEFLEGSIAGDHTVPDSA
eukprot:m.172847 g.172847  ORF g.172847 m.172847 type:complete len:377 (-) comp31702_c0_seq2:207-1337(-)